MPAGSTQEPQRKLELTDLTMIEMAVSVSASPDGAEIACICEKADLSVDEFRRSLRIVERTSKLCRTIALPGQVLQSCWAPDGSLIVVAASDDAVQVLRLVQGRIVAEIARLPTAPSAIALSPDGLAMALRIMVPEEKVSVALPEKPENAQWSERAFYTERVDWRIDGIGALDGYEQVFHLDLSTGKLDQLTHGMTPSGYHSAGLAWSWDGRRILFVSNLNPDWHTQQFNTNIYSLDPASGNVSCLTTRFGVDIDPRPSPDGAWIAYRGFDDTRQFHGVLSLYLMRPDGGGAFCLADVGQDIGTHVWADDGQGIYITYVREGSHRLAHVTLDGTVEEIASGLAQADAIDVEPSLVGNASLAVIPGGVVAIIASEVDPCQLVQIARSGETRALTQMNRDWLGGIRVGRTESISYTSTDGLSLQAWLHYPPDYDPQKTYPLILNIHGGPDMCYGGQFSFRFQRYAAEGYVVVAPNYRGSLGADMGVYKTGWDFPRREYDDVIAAVDAVLPRVKIDPARLYVTGLSAGGLMTAWVIGKTDRFAASVVQSPVINFVSHSLTQDLYSSYLERSFDVLPWQDPGAFWERSPLSLAGNITTPTLILHGDQDSRTPPSEGLQLYHALKLRKIPSALVLLPGAAHVPKRPVQLIEEQQHMLRWFQSHAKGAS